MHAFDRQTDGRTDRQTDRQTEFLSLDHVCIPCIAVNIADQKLMLIGRIRIHHKSSFILVFGVLNGAGFGGAPLQNILELLV